MSTTKRLTLAYNLEGEHDFLIRRRDLSDYDVFARNKENLGFTHSKHVLSIGCGDGFVDSFLAEHCMPNLKSYSGIYPVPGHCKLFLQRMQEKRPDVITTVACQDPLDLYCDGAIHRPDLIVIWHFLYHITDVRSLFASCLRQLQDGGSIVVTLAKPACFWSQILDDVYGTHTYNSDDFVSDLLRMGVKRKDLKRMVTRVFVKEYYDATNPTKETYDSILEKEASDKEKKIIDEVFERNVNLGILTQNVVTFTLPKSIFPKIF